MSYEESSLLYAIAGSVVFMFSITAAIVAIFKECRALRDSVLDADHSAMVAEDAAVESLRNKRLAAPGG